MGSRVVAPAGDCTPIRHRTTRRPRHRRPRSSLARSVALASAVNLLLALSTGRFALADDTEVGGTGGGIQPIESSDIRMEAETVQAVVFGDFVTSPAAPHPPAAPPAT